MATYKDSGVNIEEGDKASELAYHWAKQTFTARNGMIGSPLVMDGGFAGALDMGEYYMIANCDGVGTKIDIAIETQNFTGLGYDLLAMVCDDAICTGSEIIAITNTFDTNRVNAYEIGEMMKSLAMACQEQKVIIPGGEIAELGNTLHKTIWNASSTGIVEKSKFISAENIKAGDKVIALQENGFRANGFSLVRYVLKNANISYADHFLNTKKTWGEMLLTPCTIYHNAVLNIIGRYKKEQKATIKAAAHITGGGLAGNFFRVLKKKNLGAFLPNLFPMNEVMHELQKIGNISDREAYSTWNAGNGMLLVCDDAEVNKIIEMLTYENITAKEAGIITDTGYIEHVNHGAWKEEAMLQWKL